MEGCCGDDDAYLPSASLKSTAGLCRIWAELGAKPQYYPMVYSVFWLEHRLWGEDTLGYHLVNISLHALGAMLVWRILRRLAIPGAWLAAAIFALHPIQVESVAWISELKNTLSGVFYLAALASYLQFEGLANQAPLCRVAGVVRVGVVEQDSNRHAACSRTV